MMMLMILFELRKLYFLSLTHSVRVHADLVQSSGYAYCPHIITIHSACIGVECAHRDVDTSIWRDACSTTRS